MEQVDAVAHLADRHQRLGLQEARREPPAGNRCDQCSRDQRHPDQPTAVDPRLLHRRRHHEREESADRQRTGQPRPRSAGSQRPTAKHLCERDADEQFGSSGMGAVVDEISVGREQRREDRCREECARGCGERAGAATQRDEHDNRQDEVDLFLDRQRPEMGDRTRFAEEQLLIARGSERKPPVGDVGHRCDEITGQASLLTGHPPARSKHHQQQADVRSREQPSHTAAVEASQRQRPGRCVLVEEQRRDQEPRQGEEERDTEKSAGGRGELGMECQHRDDRHCTKPIEPRNVVHRRQGSCREPSSGTRAAITRPGRCDHRIELRVRLGGPPARHWSFVEMPTWWNERRFGIFVHSSLATVPAWAPIGEYSDWYRSHLGEDVPGVVLHSKPLVEVLAHHRDRWGHIEHYDDFLPLLTYDRFDAEAWARLIAEAGAGYSVFVAKHHDGWSWWDAPGSERTMLHDGPKRNVLAEFAAACERNDIVFGSYYSLLDWGDPRFPDPSYVSEVLHPHVIDLVERYGASVLWGDGHWGHGSDLWRTSDLLEQIWKIDPNVIVNDRWSAATGDVPAGGPPPVQTFEHDAPDTIIETPWELYRGIGSSFCHNRAERAEHHLSGFDIVALLTEVVAKGGHLLLNVGPAADGTIPELQRRPLLEAGGWIRSHQRLIDEAVPWDLWGGDDVRYLSLDGRVHAVDLAGRGHLSALTPDRYRVESVELEGATVRFRQDEDGTHLDVAKPSFERRSRARSCHRDHRLRTRRRRGRAPCRALRSRAPPGDRTRPVAPWRRSRRHRAVGRWPVSRARHGSAWRDRARVGRHAHHDRRNRFDGGGPRAQRPPRAPPRDRRTRSGRLVSESGRRGSRAIRHGARLSSRRPCDGPRRWRRGASDQCCGRGG